ncbi:TolC family outer membrane protein [Sandaracinobacteroides hominis]|uniref:TolC family outer membrane protein n=1 Tax=Sandaracinobacteroides hominis TaxID=2780086 RepID=UPI0018F48333|nr:TolC family outer membrane protein [Sandaracinobacteroides hominis]
MLASIFLASTVLAAPVSAESLQDAIALAYSNNPSVAAARARVRQADEGVPIASSGALPHLDLKGSFNQSLSDSFADLGQVWIGGLTLRQSIWEGGRIRAGVSGAEARIEASRLNLSAAEQRLIVDTVAAYADVLRTQEIVKLNENQVRVLEQELRASRDRFEVGDVTRTDVAQSEARLSVSQANLIAARGNAVFARQAYQRLVGRPPGQLDPLPPLPPLPADDAQALSRSAELNPVLAAARANERAAAEDVRAAKAGRMPSIGVQASANYNDYSNNRLGASGFDPRIGVTAGMPLFSGGLIAAQVRQAQARQSEALETISLTERQVTENVNNSWALLKTSEATITAANSSVRANTLASEGVRQENQVGSRDILDVLNAEQELLNSRVQLVQAERDRYVAAFQLLEAVGAADIALEGPGVQRYDPTVNARRVAGKGFAEFGYNPDPRKDTARDTAPITNPNLMGPQQ